MTDPEIGVQIRAILRWLVDEGHITPQGVRQIERILVQHGL